MSGGDDDGGRGLGGGCGGRCGQLRDLVQLNEDGSEGSRGHLLHLDEESLPASVAVVALLDLPQDGGHQQKEEKATGKGEGQKTTCKMIEKGEGRHAHPAHGEMLTIAVFLQGLIQGFCLRARHF